MEELGHYYTVYTTSLWVGFPKALAKQHALYAQIGDEVDDFDAAHLHGAHVLPLGEVPDNHWRFLVEYTLHSLTGEEAKVAQDRTVDLLKKYKADDLQFGLLLHTLGDTFAHTEIDSSHLYKVRLHESLVNSGHAHDGTAPDYPFLRPKEIFIPYLTRLHQVLLEQRIKYESTLPNTIMTSGLISAKPLKALIDLFHNLFRENVPQRYYYAGPSKTLLVNLTLNSFYSQDSKKVIRRLRIKLGQLWNDPNIIDEYAPENNDVLPFDKFKENYNINVTYSEIRHALEELHRATGGRDEEKRQDNAKKEWDRRFEENKIRYEPKI